MKTEYKKHYHLYILKLVDDKYYVGITTKSPQERYQQHLNGYMAAKWTLKYKPISIFDSQDLGYVSRLTAEQHENKVVRAYVKKYGFNNVRGGDLSYRGNYVRRFGWYYVEDQWQMLIMTMLVVILMITFGTYTIVDIFFSIN